MTASEIFEAIRELKKQCDVPGRCDLSLAVKGDGCFVLTVTSWERGKFAIGASAENVDDALAQWKNNCPPTGFALAQKLRAEADQIEKEAVNETR